MSGLLRRLASQVVGPTPTRIHARTRPPFVPAAEHFELSEATISPDTDDIQSPSVSSSVIGTSYSSERYNAADFFNDKKSGLSAEVSSENTKRKLPLESMSALSGSKWEQDNYKYNNQKEITSENTFIKQRNNPGSTYLKSVSGKIQEGATTIGEYLFSLPPLIAESSVALSENGDKETAAVRNTKRHHRVDGLEEKRRQHSGHEEISEVHVHIGRIEVTAVTEAAPVRRQASPGPKTMSLEEYLTRRRGDA